jgi:hypothetical protein
MVYTVPDSDQDNPTIPQSATALAKEVRIDPICGPSNLSNANFINVAIQFFMLSGALYRREPHGWHQLVIQVECQYGFIKEAHNSLGYKGLCLYTVSAALSVAYAH